MLDGSTFAIHGETRTFWVKLWHAAGTEMTKIDRAQIISCLPSTQGITVIVEDLEAEEYEEESDEKADEESDEW